MAVPPPFILLAGALLAILLSTRQFALPVRAVIWLVGVALLGLAACSVLGDPAHYGLFRMVQDALGRDHSPSVLMQVLHSNADVVRGALTPMFDIFAALAAAAAIVAFVAFTPGEAIDMAVRPPILCLLGAIGGGFVALAIMASGLGGYPKDRAYAKVVQADDVIDGDTLRMGDVSLRLAGIDAPELHQICTARDGSMYRCGESAQQRLVSLAANNLVYCSHPVQEQGANNSLSAQLKESFGRPIVSCWVHPEGVRSFDLAERMAKVGYADIFRNRGRVDPNAPYACEVSDALAKRIGIWSGATLTPYAWRHDDDARNAFERNRAAPPIDAAPLSSACAQKASPSPAPT
jgi:endonuclease YncB( thermonuclease family)